MHLVQEWVFLAAGWCVGGTDSKSTTTCVFMVMKEHVQQCNSVAR